MRHRFASLLGIVALVLAMAVPAQLSAQGMGQGQGQGQGKMGKMGKMGKNGRERHPAIRNAIRALERAKDDLQRANHDFGGHRAEALEACNNAIKQLQAALNYDKK